MGGFQVTDLKRALKWKQSSYHMTGILKESIHSSVCLTRFNQLSYKYSWLSTSWHCFYLDTFCIWGWVQYWAEVERLYVMFCSLAIILFWDRPVQTHSKLKSLIYTSRRPWELLLKWKMYRRWRAIKITLFNPGLKIRWLGAFKARLSSPLFFRSWWDYWETCPRW